MDSNREVKVAGRSTADTVLIQISDKKEVLGIRELSPSKTIELHRALRKREHQYSFAKFYSDFNAWQDLEISIPKDLRSNSFLAYLTVYADNGDRMVPDGGNRFFCVVR